MNWVVLPHPLPLGEGTAGAGVSMINDLFGRRHRRVELGTERGSVSRRNVDRTGGVKMETDRE